MTTITTAQETIEEFFIAYQGPNNSAADGFVSWAWDSREEALKGEGPAFDPSEIVYSAEQAVQHPWTGFEGAPIPTEAEAQAWLDENREDLVEAIQATFDEDE